MRKAFTLVEMIVVVGILGILMASMAAAFSSAQKKARISKATMECGEITKAILAYGNLVDTGIPECDDAEAGLGQAAIDCILGGKTDRSGNKIPVLYQASVNQKSGRILDPWGNPYRITVKAVSPGSDGDQVGKNMETGVFMPNRYGRRAAQQ